MVRRMMLLATLALVASPLAAQAPSGWSVRVDRSRSAQDPDNTPSLKFVTMGTGFRVTGGPAGTFWNPANTAAGDYSASGSFTLMRPSGHVNYYGLIFGGADLDGASQTYTYFLVGQDGTYVVRHRTGEQVQDLERARHAAVRPPGANGRSTNKLEVRVAGNTISYLVNDQVVHTTPKSGLTAKTDGIVGIRVNHLLDVLVEGFAVQKR